MRKKSDTNIRMHANDTNNTNKVIYPDLSYKLTGILFDVHNNLGRYSREIQYANEIEKRLGDLKISYKRELTIPETGNRVDFLIDDKIILEIKSKRILGKEDYYQIQRYLQTLDIKLGLLVNFRSQYIKPKRVVKIETGLRSKFV